MINLLSDPHAWVSLLTLTVMEIVLGIDNLIFLAILAGRLPPERQAIARRLGLILALGSRLVLLATITWIMRLATPLFSIAGQSFSWRDLILIGGGLFLVYKGTVEIHERLEGDPAQAVASGRKVTMISALAQIIVRIDGGTNDWLSHDAAEKLNDRLKDLLECLEDASGRDLDGDDDRDEMEQNDDDDDKD